MQHTDQQENQEANNVQTTEPKGQTIDNSEANNKNNRFQVIRRNGKVTAYDSSKIQVAMTKAFLAVEGGQAAASRRIRETVEKLADQVKLTFAPNCEVSTGLVS